MPLSALVYYIESRYLHELRREVFLANALRDLLRRKPGEYYPEYPGWQEALGPEVKQRTAKRSKSLEEFVEGIAARL